MILDDTFVYWARERERMRKKKEAGEPRPWSDDPFMANYRYCNLSREDDKGTREIKRLIRDPFNEKAEDDVLFKAVCLARFINLPATLERLLQAGVMDPVGGIAFDGVADAVRALQASGATAYSGAYMVRSETNKNSQFYGEGKIAYICHIVANAELPDCGSREQFVTELSAQYGFGTFMAGQVAADLAYTRLLESAPDHMTWCPIGPGAVRGMNAAMGRHPEKNIRQEEFNRVGMEQMRLLDPELVGDRKLTLMDVASNMNCETWKYLRVKSGGYGRKYA